MQGNVLGQNGNSAIQSFFTIYQQMTEPVKKEGIWIKSNQKIKNFYYQTDDVREPIKVTDLPSFAEGEPYRAIVKEEIMYVFGSKYSPGNTAYKYNIKENTFTQIADLPYTSNKKLSITSDTTGIYIYYIATGNATGSIIKYNTDNDTYTNVTNLIREGVIEIVENNIYIFEVSKIEKFNLLTNELTDVKELYGDKDISTAYGTAIATDSNTVYVFGMSDESQDFIYKYSITENEYEPIKRLGTTYYYANKIGNAIYLSNRYDYAKYIYNTNSYSEYSLNLESSTENELYTLSNDFNILYAIDYRKNSVVFLKPKLINMNDGIHIIVNTCNLYSNADTLPVIDVRKVASGEEQSIEAYVGNGIEWKLLN